MKKLSVLILGILLITSCRKVIDVDLNEANSVTVIEGNFSAEDSTVRVSVTQTANFFSNDEQPSIDDATVTITDYLGTVTAVPFLGNGNYELANYIPTFGTDYTITVIAAGATHIATSTMHEAVVQSPIYYEYTDGFFGSDPGYIAFLSYQDPAEEGNYTISYVTVNDTTQIELDDILLNDDNLTNGNLVLRPIFPNLFEVGDSLHLELRTVSENVYDYYTELQSLTDPSSAAPANPDFQWTNKAFGYFSAYSSSRQGTTIVE
tara:strand:- start:1957 stop:2745 length:789 start_codon:yes stop_codon:yes gene_type:complete